MSALFQKNIDGWDSWGQVYCDREAFLPLVRALYAREGMPAPEVLGLLTPATNAVFRCGDTVVKVFAPKESGIDSTVDYDVELTMLGHMRDIGFETSTLLAHGEVADRYHFKYIILEYVDGQDAGRVVGRLSVEEKADFARRVRMLCERLNRPCAGLLPEIDLRGRAAENFRLRTLPFRLSQDMLARLRAIHWAEDVVVHGDMTGENLLLRGDGEPVLIDFADSVYGPTFYEWPPIVFELFHCDRHMVKAFAGDTPMRDFIQTLLDGLALHDFGPDIIRDYAKREGIPLEAISTLDALGQRLERQWSGLIG